MNETNKLIIITTGPSQLLTAIATLKSQNVNLVGLDVYYLGVIYEPIKAILTQICDFFSISYQGEIATDYTVHKNPVWLLRKWEGLKVIWNPVTFLRNKFQYCKSDWQRLLCNTLVMTLRFAQVRDCTLIHLLDPDKIIYTADGIITQDEIARNFTQFFRLCYRKFSPEFPMPYTVYTPSYLRKSSERLGKIHLIPDELLYNLYRDVSQISLVQGLVAELPDNTRGILFTQHLASSRFCSELEELEIYRRVCKFLIHNKKTPVLIKPHPRDQLLKFSLLSRCVPDFSRHFILVPAAYSAVPIELLQSLFTAELAQIYGFSSSAILASQQLTGLPASLLLSPAWPNNLVEQIQSFAEKFQVPIVIVD